MSAVAVLRPDPDPEAAIQLTIKKVPLRTREAMNRLAQQRGQTLGAWLSEAVDHGSARQAGDQVLPALFAPRADMAALAAGRPVDGAGDAPDIEAVRGLLQAAAEVAAVTGQPIPRRTVALAYRLLHQALRQLHEQAAPRPQLP